MKLENIKKLARDCDLELRRDLQNFKSYLNWNLKTGIYHPNEPQIESTNPYEKPKSFCE